MDLIRKFTLLGALHWFGDGTVAQNTCGVAFALAFLVLHIRVWPYKAPEDNLFQLMCELHTFWIITMGFVLKTNLNTNSMTRGALDIVLVVSFVICVPLSFAMACILKSRRIGAEFRSLGMPRARELGGSQRARSTHPWYG